MPAEEMRDSQRLVAEESRRIEAAVKQAAQEATDALAQHLAVRLAPDSTHVASSNGASGLQDAAEKRKSPKKEKGRWRQSWGTGGTVGYRSSG